MSQPGLATGIVGGMNPDLDRSVLIVEDEQCIRDVLAELFEGEGLVAETAATLEEAMTRLASRSYSLLVTDIRLGSHLTGGLQVMAAAGLLSPQATVVVLTAFPDDDIRAAATRLGATHFVEKPVSLEYIAQLR